MILHIKKRIKNFETTVVDTSDKVLVFPANSEEIDIPQVLDSVSSLTIETDKVSKSPIRHGTMLVGLIVAITFSWSIYSLFFAVKDTNQENLAATDHSNLAQIKSDSNIHKSTQILL